MKKLTLLQPNIEVRELLKEEKERIFKEVKKEKELLLEVNKHLFQAVFKKRFTFGKDTVLLYRVIKNEKDCLLTEIFASYRILKDRVL